MYTISKLKIISFCVYIIVIILLVSCNTVNIKSCDSHGFIMYDGLYYGNFDEGDVELFVEGTEEKDDNTLTYSEGFAFVIVKRETASVEIFIEKCGIIMNLFTDKLVQYTDTNGFVIYKGQRIVMACKDGNIVLKFNYPSMRIAKYDRTYTISKFNSIRLLISLESEKQLQVLQNKSYMMDDLYTMMKYYDNQSQYKQQGFKYFILYYDKLRENRLQLLLKAESLHPDEFNKEYSTIKKKIIMEVEKEK